MEVGTFNASAIFFKFLSEGSTPASILNSEVWEILLN